MIGNDTFSLGILICLFNTLSGNTFPVILATSFLFFKSSTSNLYISNSADLLFLTQYESLIYNPTKKIIETIHTMFVSKA